MTRILLALAIGLAGLSGLTGSAHAAADEPITLSEAHGFQCLVTTNAVTAADCDLLVLVRYELPKDDWRSTTYMEVTTCFDDNELDFLDLCWTSLLNGIVTMTFYDGPQATGIQVRARNLPRVGHGLAALYSGAGHGLTFGDTTYQACIEPSATVFTPATPKCLDITNWHTVTDSDSDGMMIDQARTINAAALQDIAANLQEALPGRTEAIATNGLITPTGAIFFSEAYTNSVKAAPAAFAIAEQIQDDVTLGSSNTAAETTIATEAQASSLWGYVNDFNNNHLGSMNMNVVGGVLIGGLAALVFIFVFTWIKNLFVTSVIAALFIFGGGVLQSFIPLSLFLVITLLFASVGTFSWVRTRI